jgi:hypothetical protein
MYMSEADRTVEALDRRTLYQDYCGLNEYRLRHSLYGAGMSADIAREMMERGTRSLSCPTIRSAMKW